VARAAAVSKKPLLAADEDNDADEGSDWDCSQAC
jgi:hypothetical protein